MFVVVVVVFPKRPKNKEYFRVDLCPAVEAGDYKNVESPVPLGFVPSRSVPSRPVHYIDMRFNSRAIRL